MEKMWMLIKKFVKEEEGMETVEYAVVGALLVLGAVLIWGALGTSVNTKVSQLNSAVTT